MHVLVALHDELVRSCDEINVVHVVERARDVFCSRPIGRLSAEGQANKKRRGCGRTPKEESSSSRTDSPALQLCERATGKNAASALADREGGIHASQRTYLPDLTTGDRTSARRVVPLVYGLSNGSGKREEKESQY